MAPSTSATVESEPTQTPAPPSTSTPEQESRQQPGSRSQNRSAVVKPPRLEGQAFIGARSGSNAKKVFAHYFPPYPISLDNQPAERDYYQRNYLNPSGERGKFSEAGGLLRDRPAARKPISGDFLRQDARTEVRQAAAAGIDGFTVNVMGVGGRNWVISKHIFDAASRTDGFVAVPNVDTNGSIGRESPTVIADRLNELYETGGAYRLADGRYVLSSFKAEGKSVGWWKEIMEILRKKHGKRIAFIAVLLNAGDPNMRAFAPISYALSDWGTRDPEGIKRRSNRVAAAERLGVKYMSAVAFQDVRPAQYVYAETRGTDGLRESWLEAINDGADLVQLITWNDYSETTSFAPSMAHGTGVLDLNAWYMTKFKTGSWPKVTGDAVYAVHRVHAVDARPARSHRLSRSTLGNSRTAPVDRVEVVSFLSRASALRITVGSSTTTVQAPAGYSTRTVALRTGTVSVTVARTGERLTSPYKVVARPNVQDLQYYVASSND